MSLKYHSSRLRAAALLPFAICNAADNQYNAFSTLDASAGTVESYPSRGVDLRSFARLSQSEADNSNSDEKGRKCATNGNANAVCKAVDGTDGPLSVCLQRSAIDDEVAGKLDICALWIRGPTTDGNDGNTTSREHCCNQCAICEGEGGYTFDCSNVVKDFKATCATSLKFPNPFKLISFKETEGEAEVNANNTDEPKPEVDADEASDAEETTAEATTSEATGETDENASKANMEPEETSNTEGEGQADTTPPEKNLDGYDFTGPFRNRALMMTFHGMDKFDHHAQRVFTSEYKKYVEWYYEERGAEAVVSITITGVDVNPFDRRRRLGQDPAVAVRFDQESKYRGLPPGTTPETFVSDPFADCDVDTVIDDANCGGTELFVGRLASTHAKTFEGLTEIVGPAQAGTEPESASAAEVQGETVSPASTGVSQTVIIVIVIIVTVIVEILLMVAAYFMWKKRKENKKKSREGKELKTNGTEKDDDDSECSDKRKKEPKDDHHFDDDDMSMGPSIVDNYVVDGDDGTLSYYEPGSHRFHANPTPSLVSDADDQTAEYDYRRAFQMGPYNGQSVVSGATREDQSTWSDANTKEDTLTVYSGRDESTHYTEDDRTRSFRLPHLLPHKGMQRGKSWKNAAAYYKNGQRITIDAPPGKLGLVIDNPDGWAPVIHTVSPASILGDRLRVGDRLLTVDGDDVTGKTAVEVSKLIAKRCNRIRRFKIVRAPGEIEGV